MTYAVKYLAGAYRVAGGNPTARCTTTPPDIIMLPRPSGMNDRPADRGRRPFASNRTGGRFKFGAQDEIARPAFERVSVAPSSSLYSGRPDYY